MGNTRVRSIRLNDRLSGPQRIAALFAARGQSAAGWARKDGRWRAQQVSMCVRNRRAYPEIREALAEYFGLSWREMDRLIEG